MADTMYPEGTFLRKLANDLEHNGMFPRQVVDVMAAFFAGEEHSGMAGRWLEDPDSYPEIIYHLQWRILCTYALKYIDEHAPKAWFRPVFLPPDEQEAWLKENGAKSY